MGGSYFERDWCGLKWSPWIRLRANTSERSVISRAQGVYRVRAEGHEPIIYIGQTNDMKRRTASLANHSHKEKMPWDDPHTAAPNLWAWRQEERWEYEVSVATSNLSRPDRMALECYLLWKYRVERGESTLCNHGRFHPLYTKSSNRKKGITGRKLPENKTHDKWGKSYPPLPAWKNYNASDWMKLDWSKPKALSQSRMDTDKTGIYKILALTKDELQYIGETTNLGKRFNSHKRRFPETRFSYVELPRETSDFQRLEIENDLIGHHYENELKSPVYQFQR